MVLSKVINDIFGVLTEGKIVRAVSGTIGKVLITLIIPVPGVETEYEVLLSLASLNGGPKSAGLFGGLAGATIFTGSKGNSREEAGIFCIFGIVLGVVAMSKLCLNFLFVVFTAFNMPSSRRWQIG